MDIQKYYDPNQDLENANSQSDAYNKALDIQYQPQEDQLNQEITSTPKQYDQYRSAADLQYEINAKNLKERMANLGTQNSGANYSLQADLMGQKQKTYDNVFKQQQTAITNLKNNLAKIVAQKNSEEAQNRVTQTGNAQTRIANYQIGNSNAQRDYQYQTQLKQLDHTYAVQMAKLQSQLEDANNARDHQRALAAQKQMAALNNSYDVQKLKIQQGYAAQNQQNELDYQSKANAFTLNGTDAETYGKNVAGLINNKSLTRAQAAAQIAQHYGDGTAYGDALTTRALINAGLTDFVK